MGAKGLGHFINHASRIPVVEGARIIRKSIIRNNGLVRKSNPLIFNSKKAISNHFRDDRQFLLNFNQYSTYLAASSLSHTLDGWNYLSQAIDSLIRGNEGISVHLAYYAELRASMSFFATEGIGIFDNKHFCIKKDNCIIKNPKVPKPTTHQFVWNLVDKFSISSTKPSANLLQHFSVLGKSFEEWVSAFYSSARTSINIGNAILRKWLANWNFDVEMFKDDREIRNMVSYRPQKLISNNDRLDIKDVITKLNKFWNAIEPVSTDRFSLLDKYLLRKLLVSIHIELEQIVGRSINFNDLIDQTFVRLQLSSSHHSLKQFLQRTPPFDSEHEIFELAKEENFDVSANKIVPLSAIARATLMLRLSSGCVSGIYKDAGFTSNDLDFYWNERGIESGFWENEGELPLNFDMLWTDIKDYIVEVMEWLEDNAVINPMKIQSELSGHLNYYSQFNRAGLWGIAI